MAGSKSTNFRMDRILCDSQRINIQQQMPTTSMQQHNILPPSLALPPKPATATVTAHAPAAPSQMLMPRAEPLQLAMPPMPMRPAFFVPPRPSLPMHFGPPVMFNPFMVAAMNALLQHQQRQFQLQQQQLMTYYLRQQQQQRLRFISPLSLDSTPGTSSSTGTGGSSTNGSSTGGRSGGGGPPMVKSRQAIAGPSQRRFGVSHLLAIGETPRARKKEEANGAATSKAKCEVCGKTFARSWLLTGHRRIHDGNRPFRCDFPGCVKAFADRSNCRAHERTHHAEKPFDCGRCGKRFKLKTYLTKHLKSCGNVKRTRSLALPNGQQ